MDIATVQSYLNDKNRSWEHLRHLIPVLLDAVRHKNMPMVAGFLNNKKWGSAYCCKDVVRTLADSHWPEGWELISKKSVHDSNILHECLTAVRSNPTLFGNTLQQFWSEYSTVSPRTQKAKRFYAGVQEIAMAAIRYNDQALYSLCKNTLQSHAGSAGPIWDVNEQMQCANKYMCCWVVKDFIQSSRQPINALHFFQSFLQKNSFTAPEDQLIAMGNMVVDLAQNDHDSLPQILNVVFSHQLVRHPEFNNLCKKIDHMFDPNKRTGYSTRMYSKEVFDHTIDAYFSNTMNYVDAQYWCATVWQQRLDHPESGAGELADMLEGLLIASAKHNQWDLLKDLSERFSAEYSIVLQQSLHRYSVTDVVDAMLHQVNDATDQAIAQSGHTTAKVESYRQKLKLNAVVNTPNTPRKRQKI